ncbi:transposase [Streptomyces mirabilis]
MRGTTRPGKHNGNSRNGTRAKTVLADVGPVEVRVPRDLAGAFEFSLLGGRGRRFRGSSGLSCSSSR